MVLFNCLYFVRLFFELVSYLEALTMLDENGDEIYDLDYSLVETKDI
mgnify:CR=1 FL=1